MKSVQLSKTDRDDMINTMLDKSVLKKRFNKLKFRRHGLAMLLRDWTLGKHREDVLSLPKKYFEQQCSIGVHKAPGMWNTVYYNFSQNSVACPFRVISYSDLPESLKDKIQRLSASGDKLNDEKKALKLEIKSILYSVKTTKQLLEVMPEAEKYFPASLTDKMMPTMLPVVSDAAVKKVMSQMVSA